MGDWPRWLRPAQIEVPTNKNLTGTLVRLNTSLRRKRPLIYVYDLPPEFNSLLLEVRERELPFLFLRYLDDVDMILTIRWTLQGRHFKFECVNRIYDDRNATLWTDQLYGSQVEHYKAYP